MNEYNEAACLSLPFATFRDRNRNAKEDTT